MNKYFKKMRALFRDSEINKPLNNQKQLSNMLTEISILWTAWKGENIVGIARALTDYGHVCYLADLAVIKKI